MARLPVPGGDEGTWGDILNEFLKVALNEDGTFKRDSDITAAINAASAAQSGLEGKQGTLGFTPENVANKDVDGTLATNSDTKYPSQKAVKTYVDTGLATKQAALGYTPENVANKGQTSGYASLDISGKVPIAQLPSSVLGAMVYQDVWDCSTATYPASPSKGQFWIASVAGTISGTAYSVDDWLVFDGTSWVKVDNAQAVTSVAGRTGAISLTSADVGLGNVTNSAQLPLTGGTMGGDIVMSNNDITTLKTATFNSEIDNGNSGTAKTIDWNSGQKQKVVLTGDCTFTFTAPLGPCNLVLRIIGDGSQRTLTWPVAVKWAGGSAPTPTSTLNYWDVICFYYDGTYYSGSCVQNFGG